MKKVLDLQATETDTSSDDAGFGCSCLSWCCSCFSNICDIFE